MAAVVVEQWGQSFPDSHFCVQHQYLMTIMIMKVQVSQSPQNRARSGNGFHWPLQLGLAREFQAPWLLAAFPRQQLAPPPESGKTGERGGVSFYLTTASTGLSSPSKVTREYRSLLTEMFSYILGGGRKKTSHSITCFYLSFRIQSF